METRLSGHWVSNFWLWVSLPRATYAIHVCNNKIDEAPPIARWSIGYDAREVIEKLLSIENSIIIRMKADVEEKGN